MSLQIWLPLNGDLTNQGLSNITMTNNGATVDNNGKIGKCYKFDGNSSRISSPSLTLKKPISISAWIKPSSTAVTATNTEYILSYNTATDGSAGHLLGLCFYGAKYGAGVLTICANGDCASTQQKLIADTWYHICATLNENNLTTVYLNGQQVYQDTISSTSPASCFFTIGGRSNSSTGGAGDASYLYNGSINDVRVYDHCLSPKEVKELAKGLVLHYRLAGPGQPNLLNGNIHLASAWSQENHTVVNYSDSNFTGLKITATQANGRIYNNVSNLWITNNAKYTVSFWAKSDTAGTTIDCSRSLRDFSPTFTLDTNWKYYSGIITTTETSAGGTLSIRIKQASRVVYIANIKVENGAIATPFVPPSNSSIYSAMGYNDNIEYDCSGYKHNGIPAAPTMRPIWDADSPRYTTSFKYDGNVNRVNYTTSTDMNFTDNFSWAIWINPNYTSGKTQFVFTGGRADAGGYGYGLEVTSTTSCRIFYGNNGRYPVEAKSGEWHHVAFTKSGTTCKCYLDGKLISTNTFGGTNPTYSDGNGVGIGCFHHAGNIYPYFGKASDFRIYATALSAEDIAELYHTAAIVDNQNNLYAYEYVEEEAHA